MTTLKHRHIITLHHAVHLLRSAVNRCPDGSVKDGLREDIRLLKQIEVVVRDELISPTLPFNSVSEPDLSNNRLGVKYYETTNTR